VREPRRAPSGPGAQVEHRGVFGQHAAQLAEVVAERLLLIFGQREVGHQPLAGPREQVLQSHLRLALRQLARRQRYQPVQVVRQRSGRPTRVLELLGRLAEQVA
jgi:hypothetical protein